MIDNINLMEGAYFYNYNRKLSVSKIRDIHKKLSSQRIGKKYICNTIKEPFTVGSKTIYYSLLIFKSDQQPSFLVRTTEKEIKHSYLLMLEYDNYLVVSRKNISGFDKITSEYISILDYSVIAKLLIDENTSFEKIALNSMDLSDETIRKKYFEAVNLKNSLSTLDSSKAILGNFRINGNGERFSLAPNTSKINKVGKKTDFSKYVSWCNFLINKIETFIEKENYIDHFAKPVSYKDKSSTLQANNVLLHLSDICDGDVVDSVVYNNGVKERVLSPERLVDNFVTVCEVKDLSVSGGMRKYIIENSFDRSMTLVMYKNSIKIKSKRLSNVYINFIDGHTETLETYINSNHKFSVCFDEIDMIYKSKKLFRDTELLGNVELFLSIFEPDSKLNAIISEKGKVGTVTSYFESDCLFGYVENELAPGDDYVICDDFGNEWADHISLSRGKSIKYFHSKHSKLGFSASKFHEVVSQAQKNIGNMNPTSAELDRKINDKWLAKYKSSSIDRMRKGSITTLKDDFQTVLRTPNTEKSVVLVVDFISKNDLITEIGKLKRGVKAKNETTQILWLISSLVSACRGANINVKITCQP